MVPGEIRERMGAFALGYLSRRPLTVGRLRLVAEGGGEFSVRSAAERHAPILYRIFLGASLLISLSSTPVSGQDYESAAGCPNCSIAVRRFITLTGGAEGLEGDPRSAVVLRDRRLLFVDWSSDRPVYIADLGRDAVRPVMRTGDGPGEVRFAITVHRSWNDTVFVFDDMSRRMNVLSPDGSFLTSFRVDVSSLAPEFVQLRDGRFALAATIQTRDRSGLPLHFVSREGAILGSFGLTDATTRMITHDERFRLERRLAVENDSTFLSVRTGSYVIERWSAQGMLLGSWDMAAEWFAPKDRVMATSYQEAPPPRIVGIQVDPHGRVWTLVLRADDEWKTGVEPPSRPPAVMNVTSYGDYLDTQIEVFDGATMTRLASLRIDAPLGGFVAPGIATSVEAVDAEGNPVVHLWRLQMNPPMSRP